MVILEKLSIDTGRVSIIFIVMIVLFLVSIGIWIIVCHDEGRGLLLFYTYITAGGIGIILWSFTVISKIYNHLKTRRSEKKLKFVGVERHLERHLGINNKDQIILELQTLKNRIKALPIQYPAKGFIFGSGVGVAQEQIPIICQVIDDVIRALNTGLDIHYNPISIPQIKNALNKLINEVREPKFIATLTIVLNGDGTLRFDKYIYELEQIANNLSTKDSESDSDFVMFRSV